MLNLKDYIRNIPDFPTKGIQFKDITTLLKDAQAFQEAVDSLARSLEGIDVDVIVGPEARGFLFGAPLAYAMGKGFVLARKPGKLPAQTARYEYDLEYGTDALEIHIDAINKGMRVAIVDDLLATGGTALAVAKLVELAGGTVTAIRFALELKELEGRTLLKEYNVDALVAY